MRPCSLRLMARTVPFAQSQLLQCDSADGTCLGGDDVLESTTVRQSDVSIRSGSYPTARRVCQEYIVSGQGAYPGSLGHLGWYSCHRRWLLCKSTVSTIRCLSEQHKAPTSGRSYTDRWRWAFAQVSIGEVVLCSKGDVMASLQTGSHLDAGRLAAEHPGLVKTGRVGWLAKGVVYIVAGVLSLLIAAKASGWSRAASAPNAEASPTGALKTVAHATGGPLLLIVLAIGMVLYAIWRIVSAVMPGGTDTKAMLQRLGYVVSAVIYTTFAVTAIALAKSTTTPPNGNSKVTSLSGRIMAHTGGRVLIGVVGGIVIAAGLYRIVKGAKQDVNDELDLGGLSPQRRAWTERLGAIGEIGRGIGIGLIGFFLVRSAITYDPNQATGLDGALRRLATERYGLVVVVAVGAGFVAYGVFCATTFRHRRLQSPG